MELSYLTGSRKKEMKKLPRIKEDMSEFIHLVSKTFCKYKDLKKSTNYIFLLDSDEDLVVNASGPSTS